MKLTHTGETMTTKLLVPCIECGDHIELGEMDAQTVQEWQASAPWLFTNVICDSCLETKYDIHMSEIEELHEQLASGAFDD